MARLITTLAASVALAATAFTVQAFAEDPSRASSPMAISTSTANKAPTRWCAALSKRPAKSAISAPVRARSFKINLGRLHRRDPGTSRARRRQRQRHRLVLRLHAEHRRRRGRQLSRQEGLSSDQQARVFRACHRSAPRVLYARGPSAYRASATTGIRVHNAVVDDCFVYSRLW